MLQSHKRGTNQGYDRQHPDELPPAPIAGGWEGMKRLADTCRERGYFFSLHDQYRDYYTDAPSYNEQFAVHKEDDNPLSMQFPCSRFDHARDARNSFCTDWFKSAHKELRQSGSAPTFLSSLSVAIRAFRNFVVRDRVQERARAGC